MVVYISWVEAEFAGAWYMYTHVVQISGVGMSLISSTLFT